MTELCIDVIRGVPVSDVSPSDDRIVGAESFWKNISCTIFS